MAHGYSQSPYHSEKERIVWTRKGMVNQRQVGMEEASSALLLVVDDDVAFDENFVKRMHDRMLMAKADCIFPVAESPVCGWWRKAELVTGLAYRIGAMTLFYEIKCVVRRKFGILLNGLDGFRDAMKFIRKNKIKT